MAAANPLYYDRNTRHPIAQKIKFSVKDFVSKCDQIRRKLRIWSHLLKKSLMEIFIFCAVSEVNVLTYFHKIVIRIIFIKPFLPSLPY